MGPVVAGVDRHPDRRLEEVEELGAQLRLDGGVDVHAVVDGVGVHGPDGLGVGAADRHRRELGVALKGDAVAVGRRACDGLLLAAALEGGDTRKEVRDVRAEVLDCFYLWPFY